MMKRETPVMMKCARNHHFRNILARGILRFAFSHLRRRHFKGRMLQFPAFMRQMTSPPLIPTSTLFPIAAHAQNDVEALAILEGELEDKLSEIRKGNSNQTVIGKKLVDSKEELEPGAEDDEVDNVGDSEGDEFEQETG